jgi:hypothetical protein
MKTRVALGACGIAAATIVIGQLGAFAGKSDRGTKVTESAPAPMESGGLVGPDVITGVLPSYRRWVTGSTETAYSFGTTSCNIGDTVLLWEADPSHNHPVISQNMFRLHEGRFEHIGQAWLKHSFCALQQGECGSCGGGGGCQSVLHPGCSDPYSASRNGGQGGLGPKWQVNAHEGTFVLPWDQGEGTSGSYRRRVRVLNSDLDVDGAMFFIEGQYVANDDSAWANQNNNASYRRAIVQSNFDLSLQGSTVRESPGIQAWKDFQPTVTLVEVQVDEDGVPELPDPDAPAEIYEDGLFIVGYDVYDNEDGTYDYEYAVYNMNSHRSGQAFHVPVPAGVELTGIGFHDISYHSGDGFGGEDYDDEDWAVTVDDDGITWASGTGASANALRWGTLYNFRFTADAGPESATGSIDLYRADPDNPDFNTVTFDIDAPSGAPCPSDTDGNGTVDSADLVNLIAAWGTCEGCPEDVNGDGTVDSADLVQLLADWGPC